LRPRRIKLTEGFHKAFRSLRAEEDRDAVIRAIQHFIDRSAEHALRVERKVGLEIWAFRVTRGMRAFFVPKSDEQGRYDEIFHVGPHDEYRTVKRKRSKR
jgi:hypothetical protein